MASLLRFFVRRYVFAIAIFAAIVFFGLSAMVRLGVDLLPEFDVPIVSINTSYAGASSRETAEQLAETIEDAVATVPGVSDITSFSGEGFSLVIAQFAYGIDVDQASLDVKQRIDAIQDDLPEDASTPTVEKFDPNDEPILSLAVSGPGSDLQRLQRVAEDRLEPPLQQVEGVADVALVGSVGREVQVLLDPGALPSYGLTAQAVANAIGANVSTVPAGSLQVRDERIVLALRSQPSSAEEVAEMFVDPARGLRVDDVARVVDGSEEANAFTRLNGEPVAILEVRKASGANAVSTARALKNTLGGVDLPDGFDVTVVNDTTVFVEQSVLDTLRETLLAVLAVALVVLLFVGRLGSAFSVVLAIPITITGAVIIFGLLGFTFNVVTLLAITVAVGLVVDDSIVIAENVARWRAMGHDLKDAVFRGAGEVAVAVLTATLSLLAVFLPIAFLPGLIGQFFSQFGLSLAATIFVSYLEAMFFLTVRLAYMPNPLPPTWSRLPAAVAALPRQASRTAGAYRRRGAWLLVAALGAAGAALGTRAGWAWPAAGELAGGAGPAAWREPGVVAGLIGAAVGVAVALALPWLVLAVRYLLNVLLTAVGATLRSLHELTDAGVGGLREGYARALRAILNRRGSTVVLLVAAALVASLAFVFPRIQFNFVSEVDAGQLAVQLEMPPGTPLARTDRVSSLLEQELRRLPEARAVLARVGSGGLLGNQDAQRSSLAVELVPSAERQRSTFEVADALRPRLEALIAERAPEASLTIGSDDGGTVPVETGLQLTLRSTDRELLQERDQRAREVMRDHPWLRNVGSSLEGQVSERVFVLDRTALSGTGLTPAAVGAALRSYNVGARAGDLRADGAEVPIMVRVDPRFVVDEQTLLSLPIPAPALDDYLPLSQLGRFEVQSAPVTIDRSNQAYVSTLEADFRTGAPGQFQIRSEIESAFAREGVTDEQVTVGTGVGPDLLGDLVFYGPIAFALALLLNYLVIASQFNSFRYPLYLLLTVPLALVGAFWLFWLTGSPLDVISVLGVVILVGLVTKNAILLLDVVMSHMEESETLEEALVRAGRLRLRPILMTAITVLIISVPLLLGLGEGSEFRRPLGLVIAGGVVSSTFLTLFVVPAAFFRFERRNFRTADDVARAEPREAIAGD